MTRETMGDSGYARYDMKGITLKEQVAVKDTVGLTVEKVHGANSAWWIVWTDGRFTRIDATLSAEKIDLEFDQRAMIEAGIIDAAECAILLEAEKVLEDATAELNRITQEQMRQAERLALYRTLKRYFEGEEDEKD